VDRETERKIVRQGTVNNLKDRGRSSTAYFFLFLKSGAFSELNFILKDE
jgi:hypothetical protein